MKRFSRCIALLLALSTALCLTLPVAARQSPELPAPAFEEPADCPYGPGDTVRVIVLLDEQGASGPHALEPEAPEFQRKQSGLLSEHRKLRSSLDDAGISYTLEYEYTALFSGMSLTVPYEALAALTELPQVQDAWVVSTYALPEVAEIPEQNQADSIQSSLSGEIGQGMLIAILDSGTSVSHEAFAVYPDVLGEVRHAAGSASLPGIYVSEKIPYAYDYGDHDTDVSDGNGHGTQVSSIAAGYAEAPDGTVKFAGAAPGAQLAVMKIFKDSSATTSTDVYFAALEDAYLLGADVINLSIGSAAGFVYDAALESHVFGNIYQKLEDAGIVLCAAAGNFRSQANSNSIQPGSVSPDYADYGTVASPSTYAGNTSVAASTASGAGASVAIFSAWGPTPDLTLAPQISAPGQGILSADSQSATGYLLSNGTSMATPYASGSFAVILGSLSRRFLGLTQSRRAALAEAILMGTAQPLGTNTAPISLRQQGAGNLDTRYALNTNYYITSPIQELGDDPDREGVYSLTITVDNLARTEKDCTAVRFSDVYETAWYHEAVDYAYDAGLILGTSATTFSPNSRLTRGQLVTILYRNAGSPAVAGTSGFLDVPSGKYFSNAVTWAKTHGIVAGMTENTFGPDFPITREQMAAILYRLSGSPQASQSLSNFVDAASVSAYARNPMAWAVESGLISGISTTSPTLAPRQNATRAQFASILRRYLGDGPITASFTPSAQLFGDSISEVSGRNELHEVPLDCSVAFSKDQLNFYSYTDSQTITATITLSQACKSRLNEDFPYGSYVEGFLQLQSLTEVPLHASLLGFYGGWNEAPVLEQTDFRQVQLGTGAAELLANNAQLYCADSGSSYYRKTISVLGKNPFGTTAYSENRMALSSASARSTYANELLIRPVLLRNARWLTYSVSDAVSGEVYLTDRHNYIRKSTFGTSGTWKYADSFYYSPTDTTGAPLPDGTNLLFTVSASLRGEPESVQWQFPCVVDSTAPAVSAVPSSDGASMVISVQDNHYLSIVTVTDQTGKTLFRQLFSDESPNTVHTLEIPLADTTGPLRIVAVDYATNITNISAS